MRRASEFASWIDSDKIIPLDRHLMDAAKVSEALLGKDWKSVAERFNLDFNLLKYAAFLHDIGKVRFYRIANYAEVRPSELMNFYKISKGEDFLPFWFHEILSALYVQCMENVDLLNYHNSGIYAILKLSVLFHHFGMKNRYKLKNMFRNGIIEINKFFKLNEKNEIYRYVLDFKDRIIYREMVPLEDLIEEMDLVLASSGFPWKVGSCNVVKALEHLKLALAKYHREMLYPSTFALLGFLSIADSLVASIERGGRWEPSKYVGRIADELGVSYEDLRSLLQG